MNEYNKHHQPNGVLHTPPHKVDESAYLRQQIKMLENLVRGLRSRTDAQAKLIAQMKDEMEDLHWSLGDDSYGGTE